MTSGSEVERSKEPRPGAITSRRTATPWEAVVVLGLPVTIFLARELWSFVSGGDVAMRPAFSDARLLATLGTEVIVAALLLAWLSRRGWHLRSQIGSPVLSDIVRGVGLWFVLFIMGQIVRLVLSAVAPAVITATQVAPLRGSLSWWTLGAALVINPVFEEVLWLGFAVPTLQLVGGLRVAAAVSVLLRVLVHYNQGVHALVSVLPVGIVFTAYFIRTRRLWPVIVAHVINNAIGFGGLSSGSP